jgi:hypothetical protein
MEANFLVTCPLLNIEKTFPSTCVVRRQSLMSAIRITLFLFAVVHATFAQPAHPYVGYDFVETRHTESDHRECITQIFLTADDYAGYRYREDVFGSTNPTVQSVRFSNEYRRKATAEEQAQLVQALLAANVFELASEPKPASNDYFSSLDVRIDTREARTSFYSPPHSPSRKAIHEAMLKFAKRMKIDQPTDPAKATTVTEGDHEPARAVKLADILAHPDEYHGKRISVVGFYHGEFEGSSLAIDQAASRDRDYNHSVWRSSASTFADKSAINDRNDSWLRIEGIFLRGPTGHMSLWPGEIVRLTHIEPVSGPK